MPTISTPGNCCSLRRSVSLNPSTAACVLYCCRGRLYKAVRVWSVLKPRSTARIFSKLRSRRPEATSSTSASTILQGVVDAGAGSGKGRDQTANEASQHSQREREGCHLPVNADRADAGQRLG